MGKATQQPAHTSYDVIIIGGAMIGSSAAWFLSNTSDFDGRVLVVDRDLTYEKCSTAHTNSCVRQQFSNELNVRISQFTVDFVENLPTYMGGDDRVPDLKVRNFGYMYLANTEEFAQVLRDNIKVQHASGAATQLMTADEIKAAYPFYNVDDVLLGSINTVGEGFWDGMAVFDAWRRQAREKGVEYIENEVVAVNRNAAGNRVESVTLMSGEVIACGQVVNAAGPRAVEVARMIGTEIPVEPRKRYSWLFAAEKPLDRDLPLTIDPTGVHVRENGGGTYQCGGIPEDDGPVDYDDYTMDHSMWENQVWPVIAARIPQFDAVKIQAEWAGHYAYNTLDHNAIIGAHTEVENFFFLNGFSGHGLQQSPAMGRGMSELLTFGSFRTLDLSPLSYERIVAGRAFTETAVI